MGSIFKVPGYIVYFLGGIWGLFISLGIIKAKLGFIAAMIGFFIFPIALYIAPLYAGFADGNWAPATVIYGSGIVAMVLIFIGTVIDKD